MKHGRVTHTEFKHTQRRMLRALPAGVKGEGQASWYERGKDLFSYSTKRASRGLGREGKESLSKSQSKGPDQTEHGGGASLRGSTAVCLDPTTQTLSGRTGENTARNQTF